MKKIGGTNFNIGGTKYTQAPPPKIVSMPGAFFLTNV